MYERFLTAVEWLGDLVSYDVLTVIALSMLGALLIYEIVMSIVIAKMRKNKTCTCNIYHLNTCRRWAVLILAWLFAGFALLTLVPFGAPIALVSVTQLMLPIVFLLLMHVIEFLFMIVNISKCNCNCCAPQAEKIIERIIEVPVEKPKRATTPRTTTARAPRTPKPKPVQVNVQAEQVATPVKLEEKIEKQREQVISSAVIDDTAVKMTELQRRMEALRKTTRTTTTTNTTTKRSVGELKSEQQNLMRQYETLQRKLEHMNSEDGDRRVDVGYHSDINNFDRTGKAEYLHKLPSRNKFDEEEVKTALIGLKHAMDSLQSQIDAHDEGSR